MSLAHFEINFYYIYAIANQYAKNPTMDHILMETKMLAERFDCVLVSDYTIDQDAVLSCSEEDLIMIMLTCPGAVKVSW